MPDASRPPDFFLIGVPRAGTTSLYDALRQHPGIFAPRLKEACHACIELDPGTRRDDTAWFSDAAAYLALFRDARPDQLIGEGCGYSVYSGAAPQRIRELNTNARILVQLRDPIDQMRSNHALKIIMVDTPFASFADAISAQGAARQSGKPNPSTLAEYDLRDKASVADGLARFIAEFGRDCVHISLYDDFAVDSQAVVRSIFGFLGVDPAFVPDIRVLVPNRRARSDRLNRLMSSQRVIAAAKRVIPRRLHGAGRALARMGFRANRVPSQRPDIEPDLLRELRTEFRPEVERLSELVGLDLVSRWWGPSATAAPAQHRDRSAAPAPQPSRTSSRP